MTLALSSTRLRPAPPGVRIARPVFQRSLALAVCALVVAGPAHAAQALLAEQSEILFVSTQMGVPVEGRFRQFDGQINFDPGNLPGSQIKLEIATGSATVGIKETDAELPKSTWFNVAAFPKASFESTAIKATGPGRYEVAGRLAIKGFTQDVVAPVTIEQNGGTTVASGTLSIARLAFKIGEGEWADTSMVADPVEIRFKIALSGVAALAR